MMTASSEYLFLQVRLEIWKIKTAISTSEYLAPRDSLLLDFIMQAKYLLIFLFLPYNSVLSKYYFKGSAQNYWIFFIYMLLQ